MRALPCGVAARLLATLSNFGPVAQAATSNTRSHDSLLISPPSLEFNRHRRSGRKSRFHRQIEADEAIAREHQVRLVHMRAFDSEDAVAPPIDTPLRRRADQLPARPARKHAVVISGNRHLDILGDLDFGARRGRGNGGKVRGLANDLRRAGAKSDRDHCDSGSHPVGHAFSSPWRGHQAGDYRPSTPGPSCPPPQAASPPPPPCPPPPPRGPPPAA